MIFPHRILPGLEGIKSLSFNRILPNLVTLLALCCGLTAIRFGLREEFQRAVVSLLLAAALDGIDGRIARFLRTSSKFGAELDSLSDIVCFGVAPALLLYMWTMSDAGSLGWALCILLAVCCALRLARFNTMIGDPDLPAYAYNYFTGVPAPAGAFISLLPIMLSFDLGKTFFSNPWVNGFVLCSVSFLMVSRIPTFSFKRLRIPAPWALPLMLIVGVAAAFFVTEPWKTLSALGLLYLISIPLAGFSYLRLRGHLPPSSPPNPPSQP